MLSGRANHYTTVPLCVIQEQLCSRMICQYIPGIKLIKLKMFKNSRTILNTIWMDLIF